jgi:hypothetical protein
MEMQSMRFSARAVWAIVAVVLAGAATTPPTHAGMVIAAKDDASNYTSWGGDGDNAGVGFSGWVFRADNNPPNYYAGSYLADTNSNGSLDGVGTGPNGKAWGTYANDGSAIEHPRMAAFRGFGWNGSTSTNALSRTSDQFLISFEHGSMVCFGNSWTSCGFTLRAGNATGSAADYNTNARFEFGLFSTGSAIDSNYSIYDGSGFKLDTGFSTSANGVHLVFTLTGSNTYSLVITDATDPGRTTNIVSTLNGAVPIESVALYNRETNVNFDDGYFNSMEIRHNRPPTLFVLK